VVPEPPQLAREQPLVSHWEPHLLVPRKLPVPRQELQNQPEARRTALQLQNLRRVLVQRLELVQVLSSCIHLKIPLPIKPDLPQKTRTRSA
jgi:hypothetical protein